ncbi:tRNA pseudouridine(13) synthase TruD [Thalassotalea sp. M1531]|uniref:tRNA pseudouridine synthase D n=1 Tax=Thalassotalea algicola TaxID=2716224 RepID=A0A7Y0L8K0_9GAMM|nr:tRNA pseudouridine(13) synthase TruD [Thalassotalea algicola]NMP29938.1 tRNA pseudouridine(13) synthase TruD [Thalassotalea algicola]
MANKFKPYSSLPYLHGKPIATGEIRSSNSDFKVFEILPFSATGEGEHLLLHIEKSGENTTWVARQLAKHFGVKEMAVSYAGLKDRNAITQQWFGIHLPGKPNDDLSAFNIPNVKILSYARHNKKLRTGALIGNRFELTLRNVTAIDDAIERFEQIVHSGVPNYFGEQRFGFDGSNLNKALSLFNGQKIKDRKKRGMYLSAARSYIFNQIIAKRIAQNAFLSPVIGDVFMLTGSQSIFKSTEVDDDIIQRVAKHEIDITASMWGAGDLLTAIDALAIESSVKDNNQQLCDGLENFGLKQERRRMRLSMLQPNVVKVDDKTLTLSFILPAGSYATAILREVINYKDVSDERTQAKRNDNKAT